MADDGSTFVTLNGLATALGVDWHTAKKHADAGLFKAVARGPNQGKFDLARCRELYETSRDPDAALKGVLGAEAIGASTGAAGGAGDDPFRGNPLLKARTVAAVADAKARQLRLAKDEGKLISRDEVRRACLAVVTEIKTRFEGLPSQAAPVVHAAPSVQEAEALLRGMVRAIMVEVSKLGEAA